MTFLSLCVRALFNPTGGRPQERHVTINQEVKDEISHDEDKEHPKHGNEELFGYTPKHVLQFPFMFR